MQMVWAEVRAVTDGSEQDKVAAVVDCKRRLLSVLTMSRSSSREEHERT